MNTELFLRFVLYLHIAAGATALVSGAASVIVSKGGKLHKRTGKVFFWAMILVSLTAFAISIIKDNKFLLAIGAFSFYMNYIGYRALKRKKIKYKWFDWAVVIISLCAAVFMVSSRNIVLTVFGAILCYLLFINTRVQFQNEEKQKEARKKRVIAHLGNMLGTYIATFTAFVVVNVNFVKPGWIVWLLPTAIGLPLIFYYRRKWEAKHASQ